MSFEAFIYNGATTPNRLYAMLRLISEYGQIRRSEVINLMQPEVLVKNQVMATDIFRSAELMSLIRTSGDKDRLAELAFETRELESIESFRSFLQHRVAGIADDEKDHFILNQFAAWYAAQDDNVFALTRSDYEIRFHNELYPGKQERIITEAQSIPAWASWGEFLGWGWQLKFGTQETSFIPDCTIRLRPLLPELLPVSGAAPFSTFMSSLSARCPELDGGILFERCWQASHPYEQRGNRLSLTLSTALRVLNQRGEIEMGNRPDAAENWTLFPAQSLISRVTHISRGLQS